MNFKNFFDIIKIEQTLFALPFAYIGIVLGGGTSLNIWIWVSVALFAAKTASMCFNHAIAAKSNVMNPITADRHIPAGIVDKKTVLVIGICSSCLFVFSAWMINPLCFYLSFLAIFILVAYSFFKRFSATTHFYLGLIEAAAPIGGYFAATGYFDWFPIIPGAAIMFWLSGFEILCSTQTTQVTQDESFDKKLGRINTLIVSIICYALALTALVFMGYFWLPVKIYYDKFYCVMLILVTVIFISQQLIIWLKSDDPKSLKYLFRLNKFVAPFIFAGILL